MTSDRYRAVLLSEVLGTIDLIVKQDHVPPEKRLVLVHRVVVAALSLDTTLTSLDADPKKE